jgi:N6-adenosine-specific RNA methylase IME4
MSDWPFGELRRRAYRAVVLDPPWKFSAGTKGRPQHYPRMTDAEIAALPIADLAHPDGAHFFIWITSPIAERFWNAIAPVWKKQKVRYSGRAFIWLKTHSPCERGGESLFLHRDSFFVGQGFTTRKNGEDCLLFETGAPKRLRRDVRELIISPRREHSRKPDESYRRIESYSQGPYAEVFSRESRAGWECFGNETGKFNALEAAE